MTFDDYDDREPDEYVLIDFDPYDPALSDDPPGHLSTPEARAELARAAKRVAAQVATHRAQCEACEESAR